MELFTEFVAWIGFPFGAFVIGMSIMVVLFYTRHSSRHYIHIILMAFSYTILAIFTVLSLNYRIFDQGTSRFVGAIAALIAFVTGVVGLLLIFKRRIAARRRDLEPR